MKYYVENGIYHLDFELSNIEQEMIDECTSLLKSRDFKYLSVPTTITFDTFKRQDIACNSWILDLVKQQYLGGSAEQGILEYFTHKKVEPLKIYSMNTCFRLEDKYEDLIRVKEFKKVEQYIFTTEESWENDFALVLDNAIEILKKYNMEYRLRDVTRQDNGYHIKKVDIEVLTKKFGWMETHSCTYFGTEQSIRYNIKGANYTISCTGVALPRLLIPIIEGC